MAPGPDGNLVVAVPRAGGSVLAILDRAGQPRPGWPIKVEGSPSCRILFALGDGSIRAVCELADEGNMYAPVSAFAFDPQGALMPGWPVEVGCCFAGHQMIGDELALLDLAPHTDVPVPGEPYADVGIVTVAADGELRAGARLPVLNTCCNWAVAPDGVAYGVGQLSGFGDGEKEAFQVTALGPGGVPAGWPVSLDGMASGPAFRPDGRVVVTVGSLVRETSQVLAFDPGGNAPAARSAVLSIATAESGVDCVAGMVPPLVRPDGTVIVYSWLDNSIFALDKSLHAIADWPFEPAMPLERPFPQRDDEGLNCSSLAAPAVGPDNALILPLMARHEAVGGSVTAVDPSGRVRSGWPVELQRAGSEFWSIVVGSDGTVYALAIEPESGRTSSASVVAMAPDSTVLYSSTIVEP